MLVSPPAARIAPGASYTVRVARMTAAPIDRELSYRVFIDELPKPADPRALGQGVSMVLRKSLPVFVVDPKAFARLSWKVWQDDEGVHAEADNAGRRHAKIAGLTVHAENGPTLVFGEGLNGYVLAGQHKRFDLKQAPDAARLAPGSSVELTAKDSGQAIQERLRVDSR
jgi:fimbrial chaperone protein